MKIKKVIKSFEKAYKDFDKASKKETSYMYLWNNRVAYGFCCYFAYEQEANLFSEKGYYYSNISKRDGYIKNLKSATQVYHTNPTLEFNMITDKYKKYLSKRAKWLKKEIENLNNLLKEGYTDI